MTEIYWGATKAIIRGKQVTLKICIKEEENSQISDFSFYF